eukprot:708155-Pelagomonas_calceolata.AAC.1
MQSGKKPNKHPSTPVPAAPLHASIPGTKRVEAGKPEPRHYPEGLSWRTSGSFEPMCLLFLKVTRYRKKKASSQNG